MEATEPQCITEIVDIVVAIFQIAFWIGAFVLAFFTYRQAKKTVFAGSRNEVFKLQMEELKKLLDFLVKKDNFDYDTSDKVQRITLINIFNFFINNFKEITPPSVEKLNMHIELNKKPSDNFAYVQPAGELIVFTEDKSRIVLNNNYTVYLSRIESRDELYKYSKSIFLPQIIKEKIEVFLEYEKRKEQFLLEFWENEIFVHERIESETFEYAVEVYHDFYRSYSKKFTPALHGVDEILKEIKKYLKVDELIG